MVAKTGKRMYCDLVFNQEHEQFIRWMENLENNSHKIIFDNRKEWFETELELDDIENSFASPMKIYKSGKSYIVRTSIANRLGKPAIQIYDEDENIILFDQLKDNMNAMAILEVQGIRCSARSFQLDIELKQMMILKPEDLFNTCILRKKPSENLTVKSGENTVEITTLGKKYEDEVVLNTLSDSIVVEKNPEQQTETIVPDVLNQIDSREPAELVGKGTESEPETEPIQITTIPENNIQMDSTELCEVDFNLEEMPESDTVLIKQRKDVYYEMYRDARQKAKVARDLALSAYLEAKRIKNTYMLDDIINSSDDDDGSEDEDDEEDE
jgi:hypothetical protein